MENYDDDFSTLKHLPPQLAKKPVKSLSNWKADIPMRDGDATLKLKEKPSGLKSPVFDDGFDDDFEEEDVERNLKSASANQSSKKPQLFIHHKRAPSELSLNDAFLSDSSSRSPGRASLNSLASSVSVATSWEQDDDFDLDFDAKQNMAEDLEARFKARIERAERETEREAALMASNYQKTIKKRSSRPFISMDDDDILDMDMEQLTLRVKNGTVNRNVKLNPQQQPTKPQSRLLKGMRSIAQLPQQRSEIVPPPQRLRGAVSMFNLHNRTKSIPNFHSPQPQTPQHNQQRLRPLTAYKEPSKKPNKPTNSKSKKITFIRNPIQNNFQRQERDGMVFNPHTLMWEGNDIDASRFDTIDSLKPQGTVKPTLITKQKFIEEHDEPELKPPAGMLFDKRTLSWVYANEEEYDDPFTSIDDIQLASPFNPGATQMSSRRIPTNESHTSTVSSVGRQSVARSETSSREVFDVSKRLISEWKHADERFMRKFGKWIGGEEEQADALNSDQQFYEMVRNT